VISMAEQRVLDLIAATGSAGMTSSELMAQGITRSEATARPSHLADQGLISMLAEKRDGRHVFVLPVHEGLRPRKTNRKRNAPKRTATTASVGDGTVYGFLLACGADGSTDKAVHEALGRYFKSKGIDPNTTIAKSESAVSGNRSRLATIGLVSDTGRRTMSNTGQPCAVWTAVPGSQTRFQKKHLVVGHAAAKLAHAAPVKYAPGYLPTTGYNPTSDGAKCIGCPLRRWAGKDWSPVPAQRAVRAPVGLLLGEAPEKTEAERGAPFVGESGKELNEALNDVGIQRVRYDVDNVIACRAPGDKYKLIAIRLRKEKKVPAILANGQPNPHHSPAYEQHPAVHCRPRLMRSLLRTTNVVPMGGTAANAVLGGAHSILSIRGGPTNATVSGHKLLVLPTVHPRFVRRARRWRTVFRADFRRALRYFTGTLQWKDPLVYTEPDVDLLRWFLAQPSAYWSYDVETDAREPLLAKLRCIAIARDATPKERALGYDDAVIVVFLQGIDGCPTQDAFTVQSYRAQLKAASTDGRMWVGHNAGWYDRLVMEQELGVTPGVLRGSPGGVGLTGEVNYAAMVRSMIDTILLTRLECSELPKSLGVVGSRFTDVSAWKQDNEGNKLATGAQTNEELGAYCAIDTAVTHRIFPILWNRVQARGQNRPCPARPSITLLKLDHEMQAVCAGMTRTGMFIDAPAQKVMDTKMTSEVAVLRTKAVAAQPSSVYRPNFNPASPNQVRRILYTSKGFDLDPVSFTDSGDPSTGDGVLREHLMDPDTPPDAVAFIWSMRKYRKRHKLLTSFVSKLRPRHVGGVVDTDGRLRVAWSSHVPVTGRFASSQPMNVQNWPKLVRTLVKAAPGNKLVGADYDALEGKEGAGRWGMKAYLDAFNRPVPLDSHQITMEFCYGKRIWTMPGCPPPGRQYHKEWKAGPWGPGGTAVGPGKIKGKFNELRNLVKRYYYGKQFSAGDEVVWGLLREAEDDDGNFIYKDLKLTEVAAMSRRFLAMCPELPLGWAKEEAFFKANGFNEEPFTLRRRDFLDGFELPEVVNFPIQSGAAALMNIAGLDLIGRGYYCNFAGAGTGLIQQGHDAYVLEVPEALAPRARFDLEDCMTQEYQSIYPVKFTAGAEIGDRWSEV
jgi:DNA polymerase I-like protein with 3'-5' exonuclease and polymerase domains/uracil-DNA glycosylase